MEARARKKRPRFFRSLQQTIPNGLLGIDGSELGGQQANYQVWKTNCAQLSTLYK
jgi:hypothetical protein